MHGPVYSMAHVLSKFLYLGYPLEEVIDAVTKHAAEWLRNLSLAVFKKGILQI